VPRIFYSSRALHDLERVHAFLTEQNAADALLAIELIVDAIVTLERHPNIGRALRGPIRELVVSRGRTGYVALYRARLALDRVEVLAVRHQRDAGYST
jgi:plasmid stabilization system protein ParE